MNSKELVEKALNDAIPQIVENLKKDIQSHVTWEIKEQISKNVIGAVNEWFEKEVLPEIKILLTTEKAGVLGSVPELANGINKLLADSLIETAKKKLESEYNKREVFKALFGY